MVAERAARFLRRRSAPGVVSPGALSPDHNVNELPEPPVVRAVHGVAKVSIIADINPATGLPGFLYDGIHGISPTIRVNPGDAIDIELTNQLQSVKGISDDMNLHFHGLGTSPKAPADDVLTMLAKPGQTLHYVVRIPKNQEPGLYWYHPHVHGQTNYQVGEGGMSGAIVVDGIKSHIPGLAKMRERIIIVRSTGIGTTIQPQDDPDEDAAAAGSGDMMDGMSEMGSMAAMHPLNSNKHPCQTKDHLTTTLNGQLHPVITIAPHEKQFFRLVNATGHKTLNLAIEGVKFEVVSIDGFPLDTYPGTPPTLTRVEHHHSPGRARRVRRHRPGSRSREVPDALLLYRTERRPRSANPPGQDQGARTRAGWRGLRPAPAHRRCAAPAECVHRAAAADRREAPRRL